MPSRKTIAQLGANRSNAQRRHGLYVRSAAGLKLRDLQLRQFVRRVRKVVPWLTDADTPTIRAWCQLELLSDAAYKILRERGIINQAGEPRRLLTDFRQLKAIQLLHAEKLGLTPASRVAIKAGLDNSAFDLAEDSAAEALAIADQRKSRGRRPSEPEPEEDDEDRDAALEVD
jgi:hypothetical protein